VAIMTAAPGEIRELILPALRADHEMHENLAAVVTGDLVYNQAHMMTAETGAPERAGCIPTTIEYQLRGVRASTAVIAPLPTRCLAPVVARGFPVMTAQPDLRGCLIRSRPIRPL
jgi:hypothetical protein